MKRSFLFIAALVLLSLHAEAQRQVWLHLKGGAVKTMKVFDGDTLRYLPADTLLFMGMNAAYRADRIDSLTLQGDAAATRVGWTNRDDNGSSAYLSNPFNAHLTLLCYFHLEATDGICTRAAFRMEAQSDKEGGGTGGEGDNPGGHGTESQELLDELWEMLTDHQTTGHNTPYSYTRRTLSRQRRLRVHAQQSLSEGLTYEPYADPPNITADLGDLLAGKRMDDVRRAMLWWHADAPDLPAELLPAEPIFGTYDAEQGIYTAGQNAIGATCHLQLLWDDDHRFVTGSVITWTFSHEVVSANVYRNLEAEQDDALRIDLDGTRIIFTEHYTEPDGTTPAAVSAEEARRDILLYDMEWAAPSFLYYDKP